MSMSKSPRSNAIDMDNLKHEDDKVGHFDRHALDSRFSIGLFPLFPFRHILSGALPLSSYEFSSIHSSVFRSSKPMAELLAPASARRSIPTELGKGWGIRTAMPALVFKDTYMYKGQRAATPILVAFFFCFI